MFHFWVTNLTLKNKKLPFELLTRIDKCLISLEAINSMVKLLVFRFRVTNSSLKNKKFHFELLTGWVHFYFSLSSYEFEVVKWEKFLKYYSFKMVWTKSLYYVFLEFSLLCCKYICDICLGMLDFKGLCKFNKMFIYKITADIQ